MKDKVVVVLPAYNCEKTLKQTLESIPKGFVDDVVLVDDNSCDSTIEVAKMLEIKHIVEHQSNKGYGANQKSCYNYALSIGADIIIMLHPDYQYPPELIPDIMEKFSNGADVVFVSRMSNGLQALRNGMPAYKYFSNRALTLFQNLLLGKKLSEYHTGYRAYKRDVLCSIDYLNYSDDFIFDNQIILGIFDIGKDIIELSCPARYEKDSSSINFRRSLRYGFGVIYETIRFIFRKK